MQEIRPESISKDALVIPNVQLSSLGGMVGTPFQHETGSGQNTLLLAIVDDIIHRTVQVNSREVVDANTGLLSSSQPSLCSAKCSLFCILSPTSCWSKILFGSASADDGGPGRSLLGVMTSAWGVAFTRWVSDTERTSTASSLR